jgi:hypothetical protein
MNRASPSAAEFIELLGIPPKESAGWDPFFLQIVDETPLHAGVLFRDLALGVYLSGRHKIRRQIGANVVEGWSDPGTINLTPPGVEGGMGSQRIIACRSRGDSFGVPLTGDRGALGSGFEEG